MHGLDNLILWGFVCASMFYLQFIIIICEISILLTTTYSSKDVPAQWNANCVRVFTLVQCLLGCGNHSLKSIPGMILYYSVLPKQKVPLKVWCINNTYSNFMLFLLFLVLFVLPPMQMRWQIWVTSADRSHFISSCC